MTRSSRCHAHWYDFNNWSRAWSEGRYRASPVFWANWFKSRLWIKCPLLCNGWLGEIACWKGNLHILIPQQGKASRLGGSYRLQNRKSTVMRLARHYISYFLFGGGWLDLLMFSAQTPQRLGWQLCQHSKAWTKAKRLNYISERLDLEYCTGKNSVGFRNYVR